MASLLAQLPGPINLRLVLGDTKLTDILHDLVTAKGNRSGAPRVLAVDRNETRELAGTLHIEGASKDDAIAQIRAINALVTVGTTLTMQSRDATNAVTLNILPSRGVSQPLDELFEIDGVHVLASCAFSFTCEPYAYGPLTTAYHSDLWLPNVLDVVVPGDYPTPLQFTFTGTGGADMHCLYLGLMPAGHGLTLDDHLVEGESISWSGANTYTTSEAAARGGYSKYNTSPVSSQCLIPDGVFPPGTYNILGRIAATGTPATFDTNITAPVYVAPDEGYGIRSLGVARLPGQAIIGTAHSYIVMMAAGATGWAYTDYIGMVPTSWGWAVFDPSDSAETTDSLILDFDGRFYKSTVCDAASGRSGGLLAVGTQRLVIFADTALGGGTGNIFQGLLIQAVPRYTLWA